MAKKRTADSAKASDVQSLAGVMAGGENEILEKWMRSLKSKITFGKDLLTEDDLHKRSAEFLRSLKIAFRKGDVGDINAEVWKPLKSLLRDTFAAHLAQDPTSSDAAFYVFTLKDTVRELAQKVADEQPTSFRRELDSLGHLLDQLGVFAIEMLSQRSGEPLRPTENVWRGTSAAGSSGDALEGAQLLQTLTAFKKGDFSVRMPVGQVGIAGKIADTINDIIELEERKVQEFERVSVALVREGNFKQRLSLGNPPGCWGKMVDNANALINGLVQPTTEVARVVRAVADGDLSQSIALETNFGPLKGEFLGNARVINTMVNQLATFASEVTRVAREVGSEGKLGGQATVEGVAGTWRDLTDAGP